MAMMNEMEYRTIGSALAGGYRAAVYCRLSKDDDLQGESASIANQRDMLEKYCEKQGWEVVAVYQDDGFTGLNMERPDLQRMLRAIERRQINLVITKDLSRLGRNYLQTGHLIEDFFPRNGVRYIAMNDGIDTLRDNNDIAPFKNILNEMYSKDISESPFLLSSESAERTALTGCLAPFRYRKDPEDKNHLLIDEEIADCAADFRICPERTWSETISADGWRKKKIPLPHMVEPGTGASQYPHQMGKERPGKRAVYVGLLRYQRPFDESRLHRGDCFPEKGLPLQNRHDWGKEAGGLDCGGGAA